MQPSSDRKIPWPRIGQNVTLKSGAKGHVISIARGADALRARTEVEILILSASMQTELGANWMNLYYEATIVREPNDVIEVVTPREVASVSDMD